MIAQTDQGNLAKMLVSLGMRKLKPSEKQGPLVPVLILERYETIDAGDHSSITARGKELMLFDGFQLDLDTGQVVPAGDGRRHPLLDEGPEGPKLSRSGQKSTLHFRKAVASRSRRSRPAIEWRGLSSRATMPAAISSSPTDNGRESST